MANDDPTQRHSKTLMLFRVTLGIGIGGWFILNALKYEDAARFLMAGCGPLAAIFLWIVVKRENARIAGKQDGHGERD